MFDVNKSAKKGKIFVIGKNGTLAKRIAVKGLKTDFNLVYTSSKPSADSLLFNLENPYDFDYSLIGPGDLVILLAGISSPDYCQHNYSYAHKINVIGTSIFIEKVLNRDARILFFSSDLVYGSVIRKCNEKSELNPIGKYAEMKVLLENKFISFVNFKTFRMSYVFWENDLFTSYIKKCFTNELIAEIYHPIFRKVIFIDDVLAAIANIADKWEEFTNTSFNIGGHKLLSRLDMANMYCRILGHEIGMKLVEPNESFYASRPRQINMNSLYLENLLERKTTSIEEAIRKELGNSWRFTLEKTTKGKNIEKFK